MGARPKIYVTSDELFDSAVEILRRAGDVRIRGGSGPAPRPELETAVADAAALVCMLQDRVDDALLALAPRLRVVACVSVGYDNVDVEAAKRRGVWVTNTPGALTDATADLTWALILAVARRLGEAERALREGRFTGWGFRAFLGMELRGKRLAVVGRGRIGSAVAARAECFGMAVEAADSRTPAERLDDILRAADVVSLHVPLTGATRHLLDARRLRLMKRGAILVNTARGPVVDEEALAASLADGHLGGAGIDVYEREPSVHPLLLEAPNAVLLPHVGSATEEARRRMAEMAAENAAEVLAGRRPRDVVVEGREVGGGTA